jgi:hypothetical protein
MTPAPVADWIRQFHPLRLQYEIFSDQNPFMPPVARLAEQVRANRKNVDKDNPLLAAQENMSKRIEGALDSWREESEAWAERMFLAVYGSPTLQAAVGVDPSGTRRLRKAAKNPLHHELLQKRIAELKALVSTGGLRAAIVRSLIYIGMNRRAVDERGFELARRIREAHGDMPVAEFKELVRDQFNILVIDQKAALEAIPAMLPPDTESREKALALIDQVLRARGELTTEDSERMKEIARLFGFDAGIGKSHLREVGKKAQAS